MIINANGDEILLFVAFQIIIFSTISTSDSLLVKYKYAKAFSVNLR
jgi:hypothetical protein